MVDSTDQVFARAGVDTSLAPNRTVDHGKKRRRNLRVRNSSLKNRGHESGEVADHAPAEANDQGSPIKTCLDHFVTNRACLFKCFRLLARGDGD